MYCIYSFSLPCLKPSVVNIYKIFLVAQSLKVINPLMTIARIYVRVEREILINPKIMVFSLYMCVCMASIGLHKDRLVENRIFAVSSPSNTRQNQFMLL